jgi:outer membrane protein OmpA-like peptidoglycan-associated protein
VNRRNRCLALSGVCATCVALFMAGCTTTSAVHGKPESPWDISLGKPAPVKDSRRSGYWWWPTEPANEAARERLWGNRGTIYTQLTPAKEEKAVAQPVVVVREIPETAPVVSEKMEVRARIVIHNVLFDYDKSKLKLAFTPEIDKAVRMLEEDPKLEALIEGHADWIASEKYNLALGLLRAATVKTALVERGIDAARISVVSYGESRPVTTNETDEGRALNRRAVINLK